MSMKKAVTIGAGVVFIGTLVWVSAASSAPSQGQTSLQQGKSRAVAQRITSLQRLAPVAKPSSLKKLVLVAPPQELSTPMSKAMITSTVGMAPVDTVRAAPTKSANGSAAASKRIQVAKAPASKPRQLFSYCRLLNFSPHPMTEELLKDKPLALNGKNYWFQIRYIENWKVINDSDGQLKDLAFEIKVMENDKAIRVLETPRVALNPSKLKKGMVIGIAEIAPYRFKIVVDTFVGSGKAISELVFKLDLIG